ncbi:hypothetical protein FHG87_003333 [Trinorchestia longiramus]|nr:hypothetical protein FHG87_003333 [Trinorchestia longiramus]
MCNKRQRRGMRSVSSSGGDLDAWASIDSSTECISPTPQPLSSSHDIRWPLPTNRGHWGESSTSWVRVEYGGQFYELHSYLTNRSFQVYFEGSYSSVRRARSDVPRGGILSPMLFNLMMSDIPIQTGAVA